MLAHPPTPTRENVQKSYNQWATTYDHDSNPMIRLEEPACRAFWGDVRGVAAADLGCGTGRHSIALAEAGAASVIAVDVSEGMLAQARCKAKSASISHRVHFVRHDLQQPLPLASLSQDVVVSGLVLEHIPCLPHFFCEVSRILAPGGRAILSTMHPSMYFFFRRFFSFLE